MTLNILSNDQGEERETETGRESDRGTRDREKDREREKEGETREQDESNRVEETESARNRREPFVHGKHNFRSACALASGLHFACV